MMRFPPRGSARTFAEWSLVCVQATGYVLLCCIGISVAGTVYTGVLAQQPPNVILGECAQAVLGFSQTSNWLLLASTIWLWPQRRVLRVSLPEVSISVLFPILLFSAGLIMEAGAFGSEVPVVQVVMKVTSAFILALSLQSMVLIRSRATGDDAVIKGIVEHEPGSEWWFTQTGRIFLSSSDLYKAIMRFADLHRRLYVARLVRRM